MRRSTRNAVTAVLIGATALAWSGCDAKKQTEYVAGVSTQVQVPRDLQAIRVDVSVGGVVLFCRGYKVYDGKVQLPRSLGEFPATGSPGPDPITVTVTGFTEAFSETSGADVFANCTSVAPVVDPKNGQGARILRRSRQPYVLDSVLFLPMALKYSCADKNCADESTTCKGGLCVDAKTDETLLPRFTDDLVDGTGGACFPASQCFAAAVPAVLVDQDTCTYALPNTVSAPDLLPGVPKNPVSSSGDGINVLVAYDGGYTEEILDKDPDEGFTVPDLAKPQRFTLAPGLCNLVKGTDEHGADTLHRITSIRATGLCQAKSRFQPLCANDQLAAMGTPGGTSNTANAPVGCSATALAPSPASLMVLVDDTDNHSIFFNSMESAADQTALMVSLSDPAFSKTDIGMTFFPGPPPNSCGGFENVTPFQLAKKAQASIIQQLAARKGSLNTSTEDVGLGAAIANAGIQLTQLKSTTGFANVDRQAILVIGNRGFDDASTACTPKPIAAATSAKAAGIETYVMLLARDPNNGGGADMPLPAVVPNATDVALAGSPGTSMLGAYDARAASRKGSAQDAFRRIVEDLATCSYDVTTAPGPTDVLTYSDPVAIPPVDKKFYSIPFNAACNAPAAAANGWGLDTSNPAQKRVRICGDKCTEYRNILKKAAAWSLQYQKPSLAVPVFAHKAACAPTTP